MAKTDEERLKYTSNPEERKAFEKVTGLVEMLPAKMLKEYNAYVEFGNTEHLKKLCSYVRNATGMKIDF